VGLGIDEFKKEKNPPWEGQKKGVFKRCENTFLKDEKNELQKSVKIYLNRLLMAVSRLTNALLT